MKIKDAYKQVTTTINTVNSITGLVKQAKYKYNEKFMYTAVLDETAFVYTEIMAYINAKTNTRNFRFLSDRTGIFRYYDSENTITFYIGEHKIKANLNKPKGEGVINGDAEDIVAAFQQPMNKTDELTFTCNSAEALNALEALLVDMGKQKQKTSRTLYMATPTSYGDWDYSDLPSKSMDSVYLPFGVKEDIISDIERYLESEKKFVELGLPYRRGYALHGPPGNGKSSVALALANHFGMDLYAMNLSSVNNDRIMSKAISDISRKSILLLEDIDTYSAQISREQNATNTSASTLGGLLNALDGVATPHGMMTIMTTNNFESLDPALVRPGRMDYKLELNAPVQYQVEQMFERVFEEPLGIEAGQFPSMAAVADVFKRNLDDPEAARLELKSESGTIA